MNPEHNPEIPYHEASPKTIEVTWNHLDSDEIPEVQIRLGESRYSALFVNNGFYGGKIEVPEEDRRQGIGTTLLMKMVEIAQEKGINDITHVIQSEEGLRLICNVLKEKDREYMDADFKKISFDEAHTLLR